MNLRDLFADVLGDPPPPQPCELTREETRRERLARAAVEELAAQPQRARAAKLEPDDPHGATYTCAVAVRLPDGSIATATLAGIRAPDEPTLSLLAAFERACLEPLQ